MKDACQNLIQQQNGKNRVQNLQNGVAFHRFIPSLLRLRVKSAVDCYASITTTAKSRPLHIYLREQLDIIRLQQWDIVWRNYVHEMFKDQTSGAAVRQRRLALDLTFSTDESIRISKIPEISTRMATAYAKKTRKTMVRDINKLINMGLMERTKEGVRTKREIVFAFLPARKFN